MNIIKKVYSTIYGYDLIRPGEIVLLGVSGGPDSVAMFHILKTINEIQELGWRFHIAHFNHMLRGKDADEDEAFVKGLAQKYHIPFTSRKVDIRKIKAEEKGSLEETARRARHAFFREIALNIGANKIALAHNFDDQAETVLHRIIRGTGLRGLKGMAPIRLLSRKADLFIIRPLLEIERREIEAYLKERNIPSKIDATNLDQAITRNRIRYSLIPQIEKDFNPKIKIALAKLGQTSASFYILLREIAKEVFEDVKMMGGVDEICLSVEEFIKTPPAIQTMIIDKAIKMLLGKLPHLNFEHYIEILSLCGEQCFSKVVTLPKGLEAKRDSYILKIYKPKEMEPLPKFGKQEIKILGKTNIKKLKIQIETEIMEGKVVGLEDYISSKDYAEEIIDFDKVATPLVVRLRKKGDVFNPLGAGGSCKLKKFFIDSKVPRALRNRIPIIEDKNKIIWVVGYRISNDVKITEDTRKILKLKVIQIE